MGLTSAPITASSTYGTPGTEEDRSSVHPLRASGLALLTHSSVSDLKKLITDAGLTHVDCIEKALHLFVTGGRLYCRSYTCSVLVSSVSPPHPTRSPLLTHPHSCGIGDPNGPFYDATHDMYHTFYQSSRGPPCDPMVPPCDPSTEVWGHAASKDLVTWKHLPVAIWNNHSYDGSGVWTGSATIVDGSPVLMFLGPGTEDMNLAHPADPMDPYFTEWAMGYVPCISRCY